jgi:hypothetical protein
VRIFSLGKRLTRTAVLAISLDDPEPLRRTLESIRSSWSTGMDATRSRRIRDSARQSWYAHWRSVRFARHLGFSPTAAVASKLEVIPLWPTRLLWQGVAMRLCG